MAHSFKMRDKVIHILINDEHFFVAGFTSKGSVIVNDRNGKLYAAFSPDMLKVVLKTSS